jgi:Flp pilus assembly protein TadD
MGAPLLLSACAYAGGITPQEASIRTNAAVDQYMPASREMRDNIETQELFAQAAFWSHEYELNPSDLEATLKLAAAVRKLGNPGRAVEITQTARQIHPRDPYLLAEHSAGLIADQRALDALPILDQGIRIAPAYARLWSLKGAALDQMEEYQAARNHYDRALQITPNDPNILTNLGLSHALSGDLRMAEMWLQRAAAMPNAGPEARQNLALVLQLQGREAEAQRQQRLANLSQGDRKLPPPAVPALTPRGTPAQLQSPTQNPYQQAPSQQWAQRPSAQQAPVQQPTQPPRSASPFARRGAPPSNMAQQGQGSGVPQTRLNTTGPNGQAYTSASQAARQTAQQNRQYAGQPSPNQVPRTNSTSPSNQAFASNGQMSAEQQSVLNSIRQSLQPGAVGPQSGAAQSRPTAPQGHVVGPALRSQTSQASQAPQAGYAEQTYSQNSVPPSSYASDTYLQGGYPQPTQSRPQGPARDRRR